MASLEESLQTALGATQRCNHYMEQLLDRIQSRFQEDQPGGSPSPKKRRVERPSGSDSRPLFEPAAPADSGQAGPLQPALPEPARDPGCRDQPLPPRDQCKPEPGAAPYNILRAQQLLEAVMPFTEQQVAASLQEVHSLLFQWTTGIWGEPIILSDSVETVVAPPVEPADMEEAGDAVHDTVLSGNSSTETVTAESHRRRRLYAAFH